MSTAASTLTATDTVGSVSTQNKAYRRYIKLGTDKEGKSVISEQRISAETEAKDKATGLPVAWAEAEADGLTLFNENTALTYKCKTWEGAQLIIPDDSIRLYIFQRGLDSVQTSLVQGLMKANKEGEGEPEPEYNQVDLDLRVGVDEDGTFSFNRAPSRRGSSPREKLIKMLTDMGHSPEVIATILLQLEASGKAPSDQPETEEVEA